MPDGSRPRRRPLLLVGALLLGLVVVAPGYSAEDRGGDRRFTEGYADRTLAASDRPPASRPTDYPDAGTLPDDVPIDHVIFVI
ncbi:MAG: hypothetical protein ACKN9T_03555, partial [Candidatus Methylumidiphilus sp.]